MTTLPDIHQWEKHTLLADQAMAEKDYSRGILHYQQALNVCDQLSETLDDLDELITISVISCHNLANFWRVSGDPEFELKYLQLASEKILTLVPQCPNHQCDAFIDSLGCCKKALIHFIKRHPNPNVARLVQNLDCASNCEIIAKFKLN
ncbi:hypothetical protein CSW98_14690 [Vibrio sp. HA2012]|uniref:DUF2753 family protein n=1 Tax=Vibrio sp. HA2012 TaxID=1971595 RepID=UPI000C2CBBBE|nr:DUF2753 family protein [Vibrio sp. HA2012]PJC85434.1 hypothetical protein CSW98_14690 [Vibrio sp. HA2012]